MERRFFLKLAAALPLLFPGIRLPEPSRDIILLESFVAGWQYHKGDRVWPVISHGDTLELRREPQSPYDEKAIAVYWQDTKLGYIPRADNTVIAHLLDQGARVRVSVLQKNPDAPSWERLEMRLTMAMQESNADHI